MSVQAISWALKHSGATHSAWQVLISLANHANGDGGDAYPSVATIADETNLSERAVQGGLKQLLLLGEIVECGVGPRGTRRFRLVLDTPQTLHPAKSAPRRSSGDPPQIVRSEGAASAVEPSLRTVPEPSSTERDDRALELEQIFNEWILATGRDALRTPLTEDRVACIERALDSHGFDDCLAAVRHIGEHTWAAGDNDSGHRFDDLKHALGTAERIERWRDYSSEWGTEGAA